MASVDSAAWQGLTAHTTMAPRCRAVWAFPPCGPTRTTGGDTPQTIPTRSATMSVRCIGGTMIGVRLPLRQAESRYRVLVNKCISFVNSM